MKSTIFLHRIFRSMVMLYKTDKTSTIRTVITCLITISKCITFVNKQVQKCKHCSNVGILEYQVIHAMGRFFPGNSLFTRATAFRSLQIRKLPILFKIHDLYFKSRENIRNCDADSCTSQLT